MPKPQTFEHFDQRIADAFLTTSAQDAGLPGYLGIRFAEMTPGRLVATLPVRDELLTPFKTLHGGVMAGLVDHVLGCVLYPLMPRGQWAATTEFKLNYLAPVRGAALGGVDGGGAGADGGRQVGGERRPARVRRVRCS
jgi:uncharacterized protein (TIGR00369 family)